MDSDQHLEARPRTRARRRKAKKTLSLFTGRITITSTGFGLVKAAGDDIFVEERDLGRSLDGDEVEVAVTSQTARGHRGKVLRSLSRSPRRLCGTIDAEGRFVTDNPGFRRPLRCAGDVPGPEDRPLICGAELLPDCSGNGAEVRVERRFGRRGHPAAEEDALLWREQMGDAFSRAALSEARGRVRAVYTEDDPHRVDLTSLDFITIDPETAEDHDDALFATRLSDGSVRVFAAIADVSAFVEPNGVLDREARRRGASLYFPGRVIPMLPPSLSSEAASLVPGEDRAAVVLELRLDEDLRVREHRLAIAMIRSRAKLTYEQASSVLEGQGAVGPKQARRHSKTILLLDEVAQRLRARRTARGSMAVDTPEIVIDTDRMTGLPLQISRTAHDPWLSRSHQLVEEMMLLANETVAGMLQDRHAQVLYRVHDAPSEDRTASLIEAAHRRGVELDPSVAREPASLRSFLGSISDASLREELSALVLETMPAALYASQREDHFALAMRHYVHFTSPIRRYADLTIHRAVRDAITGYVDRSNTDSSVDVADVNRGQKRSRAVQREIGDLYAALLMGPNVGKSYDGKLVRVMKRQWIVALDDPAVVVRCPRPQERVDEGSRVRVRIDCASVASRTIEAAFVAGVEN